MPSELLGPLALTVGLIIAVGVLWRIVGDYITDLRTGRDRWRDLAESSGTKLDEQTDALGILPSIAATLERIERKLDSR